MRRYFTILTVAERLALICDEAELNAVLYDESTADRVGYVKPMHAELLKISRLPEKISKQVADVSRASGILAFILFTSGSTGKLKGVVLTNSNYVTHVAAASKAMNLGK